MAEIIVGSEAVASGVVTRGKLRWNYRAIFPDVYVPCTAQLTLRDRTIAAWLWSGRRAVIAGRAAAALHGARWVDELAPIELIWTNNHPPLGVITRNERLADDETTPFGAFIVTAPQRTAFDLGRYLPPVAAVAHIDALARACGISAPDVSTLAQRYKGARGVKRCRTAISLMDAGAQSPKETWLRLVLVGAGFATPQTQVPAFDETGYAFAYLDMGWEDLKVAVEYDGDHHRTDRAQYVKDIRRLKKLEEMGWVVIRVIAEDAAHDIIDRVREALSSREAEARAAKRAA